MNRVRFLLSVVLTSVLALSEAKAELPIIALKPICTGQLHSPTTLTNAGDGSGRLFLCEQRGQIRIIQNGMLLPEPFLDLSGKLVPERSGFDERGLLGLAFHPGYADPVSPGFRRFYVFYSAPSPNAPGTSTNPVNCRSVIAEYRVSASNPNLADPNSERILLSFDKPQFNHNGGQLEFGPVPEPEPGEPRQPPLLYIGTGDGGSANDNDAGHTGGSTSRPANALGNSQDKTNLLGKILRIDPLGTNGPGGQYGIPADNPFVGVGDGVREEIYAYGLRNPWRFSFDIGPGGTEQLFVADVGQGQVEEVNIVNAGDNLGWRPLEGSFLFAPSAPDLDGNVVDPIAQYAHPGISIGSPPLPQYGISVTGGYVYRGSAIPELRGKYVFGDYSLSSSSSNPSGILLGLEPDGIGGWELAPFQVVGGNPLNTRIYAFGRDEDGELYVATQVARAVTANDPATGLPAGAIYKIVPPTLTSFTLEPVKDNTIYSEYPDNSNGKGFLFAGRIAVEELGFSARRALLAFDLADKLPAGALVTSAQLTMRVDRTTSIASMALHRLTEDWGEGSSNAGDPGGKGIPAEAGDATWTHRFHNLLPWPTAGGSFVSTPSATANAGIDGSNTVWTSQEMAADIQDWANNPATNFGWIIIGDETKTSAHRFVSREGVDPALRPKLQITYATQPPLTRWESWLQEHFLPGEYVDDLDDLDEDGVVNRIEYAYASPPRTRNATGQNLRIFATRSGGSTQFTVTFRRDPRATDLTYRLEASTDLITWTTLLESTNGATPVGPGFVSENPVPGESPVRLVTAVETLTGAPARFARLKVLRQQ